MLNSGSGEQYVLSGGCKPVCKEISRLDLYLVILKLNLEKEKTVLSVSLIFDILQMFGNELKN